MDSILQEAAPVVVIQDNGERLSLPGAEQFRDVVQNCSRRFVLDERASEFCMEFTKANGRLLDPENLWLRMPVPEFWLEWMEPARPNEGGPSGGFERVGVLYQGSECGRSGRLRSFWREGGQITALPGVFAFDLSGPPQTWNRLPNCWALKCFEDRYDALFARATLELDQPWHLYYGQFSEQARRGAIDRTAAGSWLDLPFTLAFAVLLATKGPLASRSLDFERLNRARERSKRAPLLGCEEVTLSLTDAGDPSEAGYVRDRSAARLHHVRGHIVHRGDSVHWRSPHLRGDPATELVRVTTRVTL